jgi:hypothetical protein
VAQPPTIGCTYGCDSIPPVGRSVIITARHTRLLRRITVDPFHCVRDRTTAPLRSLDARPGGCVAGRGVQDLHDTGDRSAASARSTRPAGRGGRVGHVRQRGVDDAGAARLRLVRLRAPASGGVQLRQEPSMPATNTSRSGKPVAVGVTGGPKRGPDHHHRARRRGGGRRSDGAPVAVAAVPPLRGLARIVDRLTPPAARRQDPSRWPTSPESRGEAAAANVTGAEMRSNDSGVRALVTEN